MKRDVMKVAIIDDSKTVRFILAKMMKELGFESIEAGDGKEALEAIGKNSDVVLALIDWNMPVMNGLELVGELKKDTRLSHLKIMMVTTETEMTQVVRAIEAGADEYIMKPFTKDMVVDKMKMLGMAV